MEYSRNWIWLLIGLLISSLAVAEEQRQRLVRDGVAIEFEALGLSPGGALLEGGQAELRFHLRDATSGQPLSGMNPGAWMDQAQLLSEREGRTLDCKARIGIYLKGVMGARPLLDLNGYFLLVMNQDPSITVIDPSISVGGITSTFTRIPLKRMPMDWVTTRNERRLYVSLPDAGEVAVIDTDAFKVIDHIPAGRKPMRVALQPDGRYLWVGDDAGGVSVIDTRSMALAASLPGGQGHHEIAFSDDSRYAFVSNRDSGNLSIYDVAGLAHLTDLDTGSQPLAVAYSPLSQAVYVTDGRSGEISVIDARNHQLRSRIQTRQGIGPMRFSADGRYGLVLNTLEDKALVIDASNDQLLHEIEVSPEPYQLIFSRAYAYIRGLASPKVSIISLSSLGQGKQPAVHEFDAGPAAPKLAGALPLADSMVRVREDSSVFVVNPVDNTTYFHMEGMNAPMSGYLNRGHTSRAALVVDRSLREVEPGVFASRVTLPAAGEFDVAFMLNQPRLTHCFSTTVKANPALSKVRNQAQVDFLPEPAELVAGQPVSVRFRILRGVDGEPWAGIRDVQLRYFLAPTSRPLQSPATEVEEGLYEAQLELSQPGAWYLHVLSPSVGLNGTERAYTSLRVAPATEKTTQANVSF